ncbi:MAG TPA: hypothetical protein VFE32_10340 [Puia sp.]|jgi:hypothetical protein|nr:hypothetical protein [Puia sp.]
MKIKFRLRRQVLCGLLFLPAAAVQMPVAAHAQVAVRAQREPGVRSWSRLDTVEKTGFYRIVLPPRLVAKCRADLSDLRILKPDGTMVPYVLRTNMHDPLNAGYQPLPDPSIQREDSSNKHSYYRLRYDDAYRIDRISLMVSDPILYKRDVRVTAYVDSSGAYVDSSGTYEDRAGNTPVASVSIDPYDTVFRLPGVKARVLVIDIANGDNPPLTITRVASAQSGIYLLTYLTAISHYGYELYTGLGDYGPPDYDLHYFTDSLSRHPIDIGLQQIHLEVRRAAGGQDTAVKEARASGKDVKNGKGEKKADRSGGVLLWALVAVILLLLLYVSVKLARAVDQKGKE